MSCKDCEVLTAQVAVLWTHLEQLSRNAPYKPYAQADERKRLTGASSTLVKRDIDVLREYLPAEARALLDRLRTLEEFRIKVSAVLGVSGPDDGHVEIEQIKWTHARLQRAEAVVEILGRCDNYRHETTCECRKKALAAWEEGKA